MRKESQGVIEEVKASHTRGTERRTPPCRRPGSADLESSRWMSLGAGIFWVCGSLIAVAAVYTSDARPLHIPAIVVLAITSASLGIYNLAARPKSQVFQVSSTAAASVMIGLLMLASGGFDSPFKPLLFLVVAFAAYCMPVREAIIQHGLVAAAFMSPLLYEPQGQIGEILVGLAILLPAAVVLAVTVTVTRNQLLAAERESRQLSLRDTLTGIANPRAFREWLMLEMQATDAEVPRSMLRGRAPAVIVVDLDDFKRLNQTYGHGCGDDALRAVADALIDATRPGDCVARLGGDKFAVIAPEAGERGARFLAERCAEAIRATGPLVRAGAELSASVGYSLYPFNGNTVDALTDAAESALRRIKSEGKGNIAGARFLVSA